MITMISYLGKRVRCKISRFEGVVTGQSIYLNGCVSVCVHPGIDKDGKWQDVQWLDIERIEVLGEGPVLPVSIPEGALAVAGGPQSIPPSDAARG